MTEVPSKTNYMLSFRKLGIPLLAVAVTALLSCGGAASSGEGSGDDEKVIYIGGAVLLFALLQYVIFRIMEERFRRKQKMLEDLLNKKNEDLHREMEKTEALLSNVLPKNTADELMAKGKATKKIGRASCRERV